ncbi:MAG: VOC family protein [Alphaproteobacteria bacterium]|nr:VOC family protein [Alphaproteobacteria bacterium]
MTNARQQAADLGVHAVSPHLICADAADAIDFYKQAFGAEELMRIPGPDGKLMHACITINGSSIMLVDENLDWGMRGPKSLGGSPVSVHLIVADADADFDRAVAAGATPIMPMEDAFWGDRFGLLEDPFGHRWSLATPQKVLTQDDILAAAQDAMPDIPGCADN